MRDSRGWPNWSRPTQKPSRKPAGHSPLRSERPCRRSPRISRRVFQAETTTHAERKQLLRLAIESVQLDGVSRPGWIEIQIRWRSGVVTRLDVKRVQRGEWSLKTPRRPSRGFTNSPPT